MSEERVSSRSPRLFVDETLVEGGSIALAAAQSHYLSGVMRAKPGDVLRLFDDRTGEWAATVEDAGRKAVRVRIDRRLAVREAVPDLWLCAAPIKRGRIDWVAEKACELGVARLLPVLTRRTVVDKLNLDRLRAHMIEAAEQCERTALPRLDEPVQLAKLLDAWPDDRQLLFCDEEGGVPMAGAPRAGPAAVLVGPEGGFDDAERTRIRAMPQAVGVSLGPRVLRADTAAVAAVALWQAAAGDWR
jgi:16S rRNA (uracil1498-N3)-methyltransferase